MRIGQLKLHSHYGAYKQPAARSQQQVTINMIKIIFQQIIVIP